MASGSAMALPAPQAGLMAALAQGIVGGEMAWPLVLPGHLFGVAMIMLKVRSPMLVAVGMYLPSSRFVRRHDAGVPHLAPASAHVFNDAQRARLKASAF